MLMEQPDFKAIAEQLRRPEGAEGLETARRMWENNAGMIRSCIDHLPLKAKDRIMEMGPGGGSHLPYLLQKAEQLQYEGIDISATMTEMATAFNAEAVHAGTAHFQTVPPEQGYVRFPFEAAVFDHIFTVNTLYFWDDAAAQTAEVYRLLKPGGCLALCFAPEDFMKQLPFTQFGFHLYTSEKARALLESTGFTITGVDIEKETVYSNGQAMERDFIVMTATK